MLETAEKYREVTCPKLGEASIMLPSLHNLSSGKLSISSWSDVPLDAIEIIVLKAVEDAIEFANETMHRGFFGVDGPKALRDLCSALSDLKSLGLTDSETHDVVLSNRLKYREIIEILREFLGRVKGWERRNPNDQVTKMCQELENLLLNEENEPDQEQIAPPLLSRQPANRGFRMPDDILELDGLVLNEGSEPEQ